ncbi:MAG: chemotaxis protein CheA [Oscillospiraceae bacterium]|nr:chemotaxis protein CheA [Oscillospiraceae bacterium]
MREKDPMFDVFIFETQQLLESLEETLLQSEKEKSLSSDHINEIFRVMHTIKGSASMMSFDNLAKLAHALEDMFDKIREGKTRTDSDALEGVFDLTLVALDNFKEEIDKLSAGMEADGDFDNLNDQIHAHLALIMGEEAAPSASSTVSSMQTGDTSTYVDSDSPYYKITILFEPECQMENMRAFGVANALTPLCEKIKTIPEDLSDPHTSEEIVSNGFIIYIQSAENPDVITGLLDAVMFLHSSNISLLPADSDELPDDMRPRILEIRNEETVAVDRPTTTVSTTQNFISVNVSKLDNLMNLMGEIVTTESMVTKNPEVANLHIEAFERSSQELRKLIKDLQEIVMSIRMLPVSNAFQKMHRLVRDVSKKVGKEVELTLIGEETEVDKNIIDTLSDPLMHLIRNAVDHGIETPDVRAQNGKPTTGKITLEARSAGDDVVILVQDDGKGLDRDVLIQKATEKGLNTKPDHEISDKEAYNMIFMAGFSTNSEVTEFSGRGVGMDVVRRNIDKLGGTILVDSTPGQGMTVQIRIPLTLAIIEGMKLRVGNLVFIAPMLYIQESFKPNDGDIFLDPDGSEMIMIRGEVYPVMRLYRIFDIPPDYENLDDGILIMISNDETTFCLFVDELIGEQQAVIKPLPDYIQRHNMGLHGIGGCAVLGDGSISLIIDINSLVPV